MNTVATTPVGLIGAPAELAEAVASALAGVSGCRLVNIPAAGRAADFVLGRERPGLVVLFAADAAARPMVRDLTQLAESRKPSVPVVVLAESSLGAHAAEFLTWGVADCLFRPVNLSRLTFLIDFLTLRQRTAALESAEEMPPVSVTEGGLVFASEVARQLRATAARLAAVETTVLLGGESGSGKTCVARLIHNLSPRRGKPFVVVNCGSLAESLLEGELFGFRQGAYTGADRNHRGKCAQAEDGTLFLDEIDSLSPKGQASLLRVVEERSYEPLGSDKTEKLRARLIFATNRELAREVEAGRFRLDLYYRLNVVSLALPPLRERADEIPLLVEAFLQELRSRGMTRVTRFSADAISRMQRHEWPGNLRELKNLVERAAVLCDRTAATTDDLPAELRALPARPVLAAANGAEADGEASGSQLAAARQTAERQTIVRTLQQCRQNRSRAAESLGISRAAFYKKLRQFGIA